jgi:hypothetical protein
MVPPELLIHAGSAATVADILPIVVENYRRSQVNAERLRGLQLWIRQLNEVQ